MSRSDVEEIAESRRAFDHLLEGVSELAGIDKSAARSDLLGVITYGLSAAGTSACITYSPLPGQRHFNLLVDAGPAPPLGRPDLWRRLMETNFSLVSHPQDACLCCDERHERLQVRFACRVDAMDARGLLALLQEGLQAARICGAATAQASSQ